MKHVAVDVALLFLFGLLVLVLRYTGGKGFGVTSGEDNNGWFIIPANETGRQETYRSGNI